MQVLRAFHRKVHPEDLLAEKRFTVAEKDDDKERASSECSDRNKDNREKKGSPKIPYLKKEINPSELFSRRVKSNATEAKGEHWIKTDADCKYT